MARQSIVVSQLENHENPELKRGGSILTAQEPFSDAPRPCKDVIWALLFYLLTGFLCWFCTSTVLGATTGAEAHEAGNDVVAELRKSEQELFAGLKAMLAAGTAAIVFALAFLEFAKKFAKTTIWCALLLGPTIMMVLGIGMIFDQIRAGVPNAGFLIVGVVLFAVGMCLFACVIWAWADLIEFSAALLRQVIKVIELHTSMIFVSLWGSLMSFLWSLLCMMGFVAFLVHGGETARSLLRERASSSPEKTGVVFLLAFIQYWGLLTALDTSYTACSGVFGRWYFAKDRRPGDTPVWSSVKVAYTTSFGSCCCGAFIVAFIRAVEYLVRVLRREAQEDNNIVLCIILMIVECVIECIGDIMKWVCSWAYVQCAVRGLSFFQACSATFALATFANLDLICARSALGAVPILGAIPGGALSGGVGYLVFSYSRDVPSGDPHDAMGATGVGLVCFWLGIVTVWAAIMPIKSGASTIMVLFAEEPEYLQRLSPSLYASFRDNRERYSVDSSASSVSNSSARDLRAQPMLEMTATGARQLQVTVPEGVVAGQMVQVQTPEGQALQVQVPQGYGSGQQFVASY